MNNKRWAVKISVMAALIFYRGRAFWAPDFG